MILPHSIPARRTDPGAKVNIYPDSAHRFLFQGAMLSCGRGQQSSSSAVTTSTRLERGLESVRKYALNPSNASVSMALTRGSL